MALVAGWRGWGGLAVVPAWVGRCGWRFAGAVGLVEGQEEFWGGTPLKGRLGGAGGFEGGELAVGGDGWVGAFGARRLGGKEHAGVG